MTSKVDPNTDGLEVSEYYGWDFTNISDDLHSPIIFRAPPAVSNAADCKSWAEFAVTFVSAAMKTSPVSLERYERGRDGLYAFLKNKKMEDCSFDGSWRRLFDGHRKKHSHRINPATQPELVWDTMCEAAQVQRRHNMPYEVLGVRDKQMYKTNRARK